MSDEAKVRRGWLKFMYAYTIVGAGAFGLAMIVAPGAIASALGLPSQEPITFGVTGSVYVAFGLLSVVGLRSPLKFAPVLLLQLCYKLTWFAGVVVPLLVTRQFPAYAAPLTGIFASYVIGDLIAIPFSHVFAKQSGR